METIIAAALGAIANSAGAKTAGKELSTSVWGFLRPIFLKDEAKGKAALDEVIAAPTSTESQTVIRKKLVEHLTEHPAALQQLQQILQQGGGIVVNNHGEIKNQFNNTTFDGPVTFN